MAEDIDKSQKDEEFKRYDFLQQWKDSKGTFATYKQLLAALFKIKSVHDAEVVCEMLKESTSVQPKQAEPLATSASSNMTSVTLPCDSKGEYNNVVCTWP